jgi:hypothetical protein
MERRTDPLPGLCAVRHPRIIDTSISRARSEQWTKKGFPRLTPPPAFGDVAVVGANVSSIGLQVDSADISGREVLKLRDFCVIWGMRRIF